MPTYIIIKSIQKIVGIDSIKCTRSNNTNREIQPQWDDKSKLFVTLMRAI